MRSALLFLLITSASTAFAQTTPAQQKPAPAAPAARAQTTQESGNCSPNVAHVQGNVTINLSQGACPSVVNAAQLEAMLNKALAPALKSLQTSDERTIALINQTINAMIQAQTQKAMESQAEYMRQYQDTIKKVLESYSSLRTNVAIAPIPTDIQVAVAPWSGRQFQLQPSGYTGGNVEYSTDGGSSFKPLSQPLAIPVTGQISLMLRSVGADGKEILRVDKSNFVKTELAKQARTTIPFLRNNQDPQSAFYWGCNLYGCSFSDTRGMGICASGVEKVFLSESDRTFAYELDRSGCLPPNTYGTVCQNFPHLPFSVGVNKTFYAKFEFVDGTSHIERLPVDVAGVLRTAMQGWGPRGMYPSPESWVVLEPVPQSAKGPSPFAAIVYAPTDISPGGYHLFIGLRGCADKETAVKTDGWLSDEDGGGLIRQRPTFGLQKGARITQEQATALLSKPATITFAVDTEGRGRLGPYLYRFDPKAPILTAARLATPARIQCGQNAALRTAISCIPAPETRIAWLRVKAVRFGPKTGQWTDMIEPAYTPDKFLFQESNGDLPFIFEIPKDWTDVFHQIVFDDGRTSEIERVRVGAR